jgi:5-methylcytosine-specific restriction protein A
MSSALSEEGSSREWREIRARILADSPLCHHCGTAPADTVDHLISRAHGGTDAPENLVPACGPCNYSRGKGEPNALPSRPW